MVTFGILATFLGFYCCYGTSRRAVHSRPLPAHGLMAKNPGASNGLGLLFLSIGLLLCIVALGTGSGIFSFLVILMTLGSLVVLVSPLRFMSRYAIALLFVLSFILELCLS